MVVASSGAGGSGGSLAMVVSWQWRLERGRQWWWREWLMMNHGIVNDSSVYSDERQEEKVRRKNKGIFQNKMFYGYSPSGDVELVLTYHIMLHSSEIKHLC